MSATRQDIERWLKEAKKQGASHLIVALDTFDYDNYPVYVKPTENVHEVIGKHHGNMQRVDEVYNMSMDIQEQLNEHRAWNIESPEKSEK